MWVCVCVFAVQYVSVCMCVCCVGTVFGSQIASCIRFESISEDVAHAHANGAQTKYNTRVRQLNVEEKAAAALLERAGTRSMLV